MRFDRLTLSQKTLLLLTAFMATIFLVVLMSSNKASAAYDGGRLIDNGIFLDAASMSAQDIQNFLVSKNSGLANRSFTLDCYGPTSKERQWYTAVGAPCDQIIPASSIIYYASQIYGVNPRVVLATLQKEQSLVTSPNPTDWQINQAMGYACPTTGGCGSSTFPYQIDSGVWVLRYHYERANGNMSWWNPATSWTCGVEKNFYKPNLYPSQNVNFYDEDNVYYRTHYLANAATSSFYCYTPHAYNNPQGLYGRSAYGTTGRYYSGSYNFVYFFELWFGPTQLPYAFKSPSQSTIYYTVDNYKIAVPAMGILQDYGISPESIQTISQSAVDAIPYPPQNTGITPNLGFLIKSTSDSDADGGSVYVVSVGKKHQVISMQQFYDFGFLESQISYLPLSYINSLQSAPSLSNFIQAPNQSVFKVQSANKHLIFEYDTFVSLNPSGNYSRVSYYTVNLIQSGNPINNRDILIKKQGTESVYLYTNSSYHQVTTFEALNCWGLNSTLQMPIYRVVDNSYISEITLNQPIDSCIYNDGGTQKILNGSTKIPIPSGFSIPPAGVLPSNLQTVLNRLSTRTNPLSPYVRSPENPSVWYINSGIKDSIPTYQNFVLLGLSSPNIDYIPTSTIAHIPNGGIKLANGRPIKTNESSQVFTAFNNSRVAYASSDDFLAYGNSWSDIESYPASVLDTSYPNNSGIQISKYLYSSNALKVYLVDINGCYGFDTNTLTDYGKSYSTISTTQPYPSSMFMNLNLGGCKTATKFAKAPNQSTVYYINGGQKRLITRWDTLVALAGTPNPAVINLSDSTLNTITTGSQLD